MLKIASADRFKNKISITKIRRSIGGSFIKTLLDNSRRPKQSRFQYKKMDYLRKAHWINYKINLKHMSIYSNKMEILDYLNYLGTPSQMNVKAEKV